MNDDPFIRHTILEARRLQERSKEQHVGSMTVYYDKSLAKTRMIIQLDKDRYWFLSIFFDSNTGKLLKYCLDYEGASDSHYEFKDEGAVRKLLYQDGDHERYIEDVFIRYISGSSGWRLVDLIDPYITAQFHYD